jgi:hypothetical protein
MANGDEAVEVEELGQNLAPVARLVVHRSECIMPVDPSVGLPKPKPEKPSRNPLVGEAKDGANRSDPKFGTVTVSDDRKDKQRERS